MRISNGEISRVFDLVGDLLELKGGEDAAKAAAYRRASRAIDAHPGEVAALHREGRLREIPGVGEALAKKIAEFVETGRLGYYERLAADVPPGVLDLLRIPGVGARTAGLLYRELGLIGVDHLEEAVRSGALRRLPGFGPKKEESLLAGIAVLRARPSGVPLAVARPVGLSLIAELRSLPGVLRADLAGSVRRWREWVTDLDLVAATEDRGGTAAAFEAFPGVLEVRSETRPDEASLTARFHPGLTVNLHLVEPDRFFTALQYHTGSREHNAALRDRAAGANAAAGANGVTGAGAVAGANGVAGTGAVAGANSSAGADRPPTSEEEVYRRLGLPFIPPELREGMGEVEAAAKGRLPRLVELGDIRGDLHAHSDWSDGLASLDELAAAARLLGYEYLAVTDHSKSLAMARGLDEKRLLDQKEAIEKVNAVQDGFRLLAGVEVDILAGGELDLPDPVLAEMDVVVASIHSGLRQPAERITGRLVAAAANEHVDIIGHPTGRLIGRREASALDIETLLEAASEHGVMLEINSSPERLDLKDADARRAKEKGCRVTLGTDAHNPRYFGDMVYGVATARRAWLEPEDVANSRPWVQLRKLFRR
jgi:DNA polymerase (family 10)